MTFARVIVKILKGIVLSCIGLTLSFAFLIFYLYYATAPFHDLLLQSMDRTLEASVVHPQDSQVIERHRFLGTRYTDTTECTFAVGEIRSTSLTPDEILSAYKNASVAGIGDVHTEIINENTSLPLDNPADDWIIDFREKIAARDSRTYYIVYLYKPGQLGLGDERCAD